MSEKKQTGSLQTVIRWICSTFAILNGLLLVGIALLTGLDVVSSAFFTAPIPGTIEISVLLLPWIICGGLAYALIKNYHVRVSIVIDRLPSKVRKGVDVFSNIAGLFFCGCLTYGGVLHFWSSWAVKEPMFAALLTLPAWLGKLAIPVGFFLLGVTFLLKLIKPFTQGE